MRPDVKLGIFVSMVVLVVLGGYYLYRDNREAPIPVDGLNANGLVERAKPSASQSNRQVANTTKANRPARRSSNQVRQSAKPRQQTTNRRNVAQSPVRQGQSGSSPSLPARRRQTQRPPSATRSQNSVVAQRQTAGTPASANPGSKPSQSAIQKPAAMRPTQKRHVASNKQNQRTAVSSPSIKPTSRQPVKLVATHHAENRAAPETHRVLPGETLASISQMYYGQAHFAKLLLKANPSVSDPRSLRVGMLIKIPARDSELANNRVITKASPATPTKKIVGQHYIVKSGDSLFMIAKHELGGGARWKEIFELNKQALGNNPNRLKVGQSLLMPAS